MCAFIIVSPMIWVPNQLVGAPSGTDVTIDCQTEAYPKSINYWSFRDSKTMLFPNKKYVTLDTEKRYHIHMRLTIRDLSQTDFGNYKCISKNSLGETEGSIRLYGIYRTRIITYRTCKTRGGNVGGALLILLYTLQRPEFLNFYILCNFYYFIFTNWYIKSKPSKLLKGREVCYSEPPNTPLNYKFHLQLMSCSVIFFKVTISVDTLSVECDIILSLTQLLRPDSGLILF